MSWNIDLLIPPLCWDVSDITKYLTYTGFHLVWLITFQNKSYMSVATREVNPLAYVGWVGEMSLTHWGRVSHICTGNLTIICSDNGLVPVWHQAIIWTNAGILLIGPLGTNFSEIFIEILIVSFKKMHLKVPSVEWRPFCLGLNVLKWLHFWHSQLFMMQLCFIKNQCYVGWWLVAWSVPSHYSISSKLMFVYCCYINF